ncbi:MAG: LPS export ABC transporter permease LptF [Nitrospirota bacterium]|nr:LPS export ABC transporter permease LptF [Nitrospirota bacterium]MDH5585410.1 LPS export ABC transporter permease LptF [Nitrospirota bacterium]MDH5773591.1 LPS export ABC transporter permease LptF [Nitrospirota bacterium]
MLDRYLIREVLKPSMLVCGLFIVLFAGYSWIVFLAQAVDALLSTSMLLKLIVLKVAIALEVLLPVSLYFGVILGLGRLYADSEMKALLAAGVSPYRVMGAIFLLSACVAILVGVFSLYLRPLAYQESYRVKAQAEAGLGISHLEPGHFYDRRDGSLVLFAEEVDQPQRELKRVFVQSEKGEKLRIISAKKAGEQFHPESGMAIPVVFDGFEYKFTRNGRMTHMSHFEKLFIYPEEAIQDYRRKAVPTLELVESETKQYIAEFQWRCTAPFSTILLGLLGIPLSRSSPRKGKYAKIFTATILFALYYFVGLMVKALVEQGTLPIFPGLWWIVIGLGILVSALALIPKFSSRQLLGA